MTTSVELRVTVESNDTRPDVEARLQALVENAMRVLFLPGQWHVERMPLVDCITPAGVNDFERWFPGPSR